MSSLHVDKPHKTPYAFLETIVELFSLYRDTYAHLNAIIYDFGDNKDVLLATFYTLLFDGINMFYNPD
jgi:hypothetical protein